MTIGKCVFAISTVSMIHSSRAWTTVFSVCGSSAHGRCLAAVPSSCSWGCWLAWHLVLGLSCGCLRWSGATGLGKYPARGDACQRYLDAPRALLPGGSRGAAPRLAPQPAPPSVTASPFSSLHSAPPEQHNHRLSCSPPAAAGLLSIPSGPPTSSSSLHPPGIRSPEAVDRCLTASFTPSSFFPLFCLLSTFLASLDRPSPPGQLLIPHHLDLRARRSPLVLQPNHHDPPLILDNCRPVAVVSRLRAKTRLLPRRASSWSSRGRGCLLPCGFPPPKQRRRSVPFRDPIST